MQKYIDQLIEDIEEIIEWKTNYKPQPKPSDDMEAEFAEIERYVSGEGEVVFGEECGLEKIQFPPPARLTLQQMNDVANAMDRLTFAFNLRAALPDVIPIVKAYQTFVGILERKVMIMDFGMVTMEFCDYECQHCPWGLTYCTCTEFGEEAEQKEIQKIPRPPIAPANELFKRQLSEMEYLQKRMDESQPSNWYEDDSDLDDELPF